MRIIEHNQVVAGFRECVVERERRIVYLLLSERLLVVGMYVRIDGLVFAHDDDVEDFIHVYEKRRWRTVGILKRHGQRRRDSGDQLLRRVRERDGCEREIFVILIFALGP